MREILIVGRADDCHTERQEQAAAAAGFGVSVLQLGGTAKPPTVRASLGGFEISDDRLVVDDDLVRRCAAVIYLPLAVNEAPIFREMQGMPAIAAREWRETVQSVLMYWSRLPGTRWPIKPSSETLQARKLYLLRRARDAGLLVPHFQAGNQASCFDELFVGDRVVAKSLSAWQEIAPGSYFNTTEVVREQVQRAMEEAASATLLMLQRLVNSVSEIRCYYLFGQTFGVRMIRLDDTVPVDIRLADSIHLRAELCGIDPKISAQLDEFCREELLDYCCFDLLERADGETWLVDVNPTGSWSHLFDRFGIDVDGIMMNILMQELL